MGNFGKATEPCISTTSDNQHKWLTSIWQSLVSLLIHVQTACIWLREKERWLFDEVVGHVGIYGSKGPRVCRRSTPVLFQLLDGSSSSQPIMFQLHFWLQHAIFFSKKCVANVLIRSIFAWEKTAIALKCSCNFFHAKIEWINTVARHVLL